MDRQPSHLTPEQRQDFKERGYCFPIPVLNPAEIARFRDKFLKYRQGNQERLKSPARQSALRGLFRNALCRSLGV